MEQSQARTLPSDVAVRIVRDAVLSRMYEAIRDREIREAMSYIAPVFGVWSRVAYYERNFPGSTDAEASVVFEP
jgi:hypothetical protein